MEKSIKFGSYAQVQALFGLHDEHLRAIEKEFKVRVSLRGEHLNLSGTSTAIKKAEQLIYFILGALAGGQKDIDSVQLRYLLKEFHRRITGISAGRYV